MKMKMKKLFVCFLIGTIGLTGCYYYPQSSSESNDTISDGKINTTFIGNDSMSDLDSDRQIKNENVSNEGWVVQKNQNGQLPDCYNFIPFIGVVDNYLEVIVGSSTDVAIKVMHLETDKCVRFVFINGGSSYQIKNIPEGRYYLKIAYGKDWFSKAENGQCVGKFTKNTLFEKGENIMDFIIKHKDDGSYSVPSFELELDILQSDTSNKFNAQKISEDEFNQ